MNRRWLREVMNNHACQVVEQAPSSSCREPGRGKKSKLNKGRATGASATSTISGSEAAEGHSCPPFDFFGGASSHGRPSATSTSCPVDNGNDRSPGIGKLHDIFDLDWWHSLDEQLLMWSARVVE
eukprot:g7590.t1